MWVLDIPPPRLVWPTTTCGWCACFLFGLSTRRLLIPRPAPPRPAPPRPAPAPASNPPGQFIYVIRKRIKLDPEKAIFIFVNDTIPQTCK